MIREVSGKLERGERREGGSTGTVAAASSCEGWKRAEEGPGRSGPLVKTRGGGGDPWSKDTAGERQPLLRSVIDDRA